MPDESIREALSLLERPAEPPPGTSDALFARLVDELASTPVEALRRREPATRAAARQWMRPPMVAIATAVAVLAAAVAVVTMVARPPSALAVVEEARARFARLPAFEADVYRRQPGSDLADLPADLLPTAPELVVERHVQYQDGSHWRTTVTANSYAAAPPELARFFPERPGDFVVADGTSVGVYGRTANRMLVQPLDEMDPTARAVHATADLSPELRSFPALEGQLAEGSCRSKPDAVVLARNATRIDCGGEEGEPDFAFWIDTDTGLLLRLVGYRGDRGERFDVPFLLEARRLDLRPSFDGDVFRVQPPAGGTVAWAGAGPPPAEYLPAPGTGAATTTAVAAGGVTRLAAGADAVWALGSMQRPEAGGGPQPRTLSKLDPATGSVLFTVPVDAHDEHELAVDDRSVWVGWSDLVAYGTERSFQRNRSGVDRFDPVTGAKTATVLTVDDSAPGAGVVAGDDQLWFVGGRARNLTFGGVSTTYNTLLRLDPGDGRQMGEVALGGYVLTEPVIADGLLWVTAGRVNEANPRADDEAWIWGIDNSGTITTRFRLPVQPGAITGTAVKDGQMWVVAVGMADGEPGTVSRIDLETGRAVSSTAAGVDPSGLVVADGSVWVVNQGDATLVQLDAQSLAPGRVINTGGRPFSLEATRDTLWVGDPVDGTVKRIDLDP